MSDDNASPFNERFSLGLNYLGLIYLGEKISIGGFAERIERQTNYKDLPVYLRKIDGTIKKDNTGKVTVEIKV